MDEAEIIQGMVFRRNLDVLPRGNDIIDKTADIALKQCVNIRNEATEICRELLLIESVARKIDVALRVIRPTEKQIIELKYFLVLTWAEVASRQSYFQ